MTTARDRKAEGRPDLIRVWCSLIAFDSIVSVVGLGRSTTWQAC